MTLVCLRSKEKSREVRERTVMKAEISEEAEADDVSLPRPWEGFRLNA
jgi:hypothetical protein